MSNLWAWLSVPLFLMAGIAQAQVTDTAALDPDLTSRLSAIEAQNQQILGLLEQGSCAPSNVYTACGCSGCCCPGWTFTADAVFLTRSRPDSTTLIQVSSTDDEVVLRGSDLGFDFQVGPRLSLIRHFRSCCDLEFNYLTIHNWRTDPISRAGTFTLLGFNITNPDHRPGLRSRLHSLEANVRSPVAGRHQFLIGFRGIEMGDQFELWEGGFDRTMNWTTTQNRLYGLQVGAMLHPIDNDLLRIDTGVKAGAYHNSAKSYVTQIFVAAPNAQGQAHDLSFFGETWVSAAVPLTDHATVRFGYQLALLDNVALPLDQYRTHDISTGEAVTVFGGSVLYHGGSLGFELTW
jgi:hypothetical protein